MLARIGFSFGVGVLGALLLGAPTAGAQTISGPTRRTPPSVSKLRPAAPTVQTTLGYAKIEVRTDQPLASARGGLVALGVKFAGTGNVASVQVPGSASYPIGPFSGAFEHTIKNADIRALLRRDEAGILARCRSTLDTNKVDSIDTVHDTVIPMTVNGADGAVIASTSLPYQLGLTCKAPPPPLAASIGYAKIELNINQPLANAKGGLVAFSIKYNGSGSVASAQVPGSGSYPLGAHSGSFEQTIANADIRMLLKRDEQAIVDRCRSTLDTNKVSTISTVHDTQIPVTVNAANGAVVASTSVRYQLGLTCTR